MILLLAVVLPLLFWPQGVDTAAELRSAGIAHIAVPSPDAAAQWRTITGMSADPVDLSETVKLPTPGVVLQIDEASASRVPWVTSNGWRFMRQPQAKFYYDIPPNIAALAAAEASCFGGESLIHTESNGVEPLAKMIDFLRAIDTEAAKPIADIGFIDNNSSTSAEVLNLLVRDNLLFKIVPASGPGAKLTVQLGSKDYPASSVKDADSIVHAIRANLTDAKRTVRIFGSSVVIVHLTGEIDKPRLHLLNYGAGAHIRVAGFRVRVLGRYSQFRVHSFGAPGEHLLDYEVQSDATEFTVPELQTYAVIDLAH